MTLPQDLDNFDLLGLELGTDDVLPDVMKDLPLDAIPIGDVDAIPIGDVDAIPIGDVDAIPIGDVDAIPIGDVDAIPILCCDHDPRHSDQPRSSLNGTAGYNREDHFDLFSCEVNSFSNRILIKMIVGAQVESGLT